MLRRTLIDIAIIAMISVSLTVVSYALRPGALSEPGGPPPSGQAQALFQSIPFDTALKMHASGEALFADARSYEAYQDGHIPGAVHLEPYEFDTWSLSVAEQYPSTKAIITYCEGATCNLARELAEKMTWLGFEKVYYLVDGWGAWQAQNHPVETGAAAESD